VSEVQKKHILLSLESEMAQKVEALLADCEVELYSDELARDSYDFVFEQDPNYKIEGDEKVLIFSDDYTQSEHSILAPSHLDNEVIKTYLCRYIGEDSSINIETQIIGECTTFRITEPFSIGHYLDILSTTLHKNNSAFEKVVEAYVKVSNYYFTKLKALPVEVDLVVSSSLVALQFHAPIEDHSEILDTSNLCKELDSNVVDNYYLKKSNELVISLTWLNDNESRTILRHHLDGYRKASQHEDVYNGFNKLLGLEKEDVEFKIEKKEGEAKRSSFAVIKKVIDFIKSKKDNEPDLFEFKTALGEYPNKEVLAGLVDEDIDFIEKAISSYNVYDTINSTVKGSRETALQDSEIAAKLSDALEEMDSYEVVGMFNSEEEALQRISGSKEDLGEESTLVSDFADDFAAVTKVSGGENEQDENQLVKGSKEDLGEEATIISGNRETIDDAWKVKRSALAEKIKDEVMKVTSIGGHTNEEIHDRVQGIIKEELGVNDNVAQSIKDSLLDNVSSQSVGETIGESDSAEVFLRLDNDRLRGQLSTKMDQILRMKRIIDTMKADFIAKKEAEKALQERISEAGADSADAKFKAAEIQIAALLKEVNIKEKREEQLIKGHEHALKNKDHRILLLEDKVSDLKEKNTELNDSRETKEKIAELDAENKNLMNQLKITNDRFEAISEKYDKEVTNAAPQFAANNDSGLQSLLDKEKEKVVGLQQQINEFKKQLLAKASEAPQESSSSPEPAAQSNVRLKELEVQLKASELETKKYEQKIKFMSSQMAELEKKLKKVAGRSSGGGANKGASDLNIKRLEKNLEKINVLNDKLQADMTEKKKELHKSKQENSIMRNKITELEKKLSKFEKKAA